MAVRGRSAEKWRRRQWAVGARCTPKEGLDREGGVETPLARALLLDPPLPPPSPSSLSPCLPFSLSFPSLGCPRQDDYSSCNSIVFRTSLSVGYLQWCRGQPLPGRKEDWGGFVWRRLRGYVFPGYAGHFTDRLGACSV